MKTVSALAALLGLSLVSGTAFAQLSTLPPSSATDASQGGNAPQGDGVNAGTSHWDSPTGIKQYNYGQSGTQNGNVPLPAGFGSSAPSAVATDWASIQANGGFVRAIFTGETAGWKNDFGYTYDKSPVTDPASSYTVWSGIQSPGVTATNNPAFGDFVDVSFVANDPLAKNFDFWLNAGAHQNFSSYGGVYTVLDPSNSQPNQDHVKWLSAPIQLNTFVTTSEGSGYENVSTYVFALEDWNLSGGPYNDKDFSDLIVSLQFYGPGGVPVGGGSPVPEASTYGLVGAAGLLGLAALRRRKSAQAKA